MLAMLLLWLVLSIVILMAAPYSYIHTFLLFQGTRFCFFSLVANGKAKKRKNREGLRKRGKDDLVTVAETINAYVPTLLRVCVERKKKAGTSGGTCSVYPSALLVFEPRTRSPKKRTGQSSHQPVITVYCHPPSSLFSPSPSDNTPTYVGHARHTPRAA